MPGAVAPHRRLLAWVLTGPAGHFAGGALDFGEALWRYGLARLRRHPPARLRR